MSSGSEARESSFGVFVARRPGLGAVDLGSAGKRPALGPLLVRIFLRPFTAPSLVIFWRRWNPVYGYFLGKYVYGPIRAFLPRPLSMIATFAFSGFFLHDAPAWAAGGRPRPPHGVTVWFAFIALGVVSSEKLNLRMDGLRPGARVALHAGFLVGTYLLMRAVG